MTDRVRRSAALPRYRGMALAGHCTVGLPVACAQPSSRGGTASRRALRAQPPGSVVNACVRCRSRSAKPSATCMQSLALKRFHMLIPALLDRFRYAKLRYACLHSPCPVLNRNTRFQMAIRRAAPRAANRISSKKFAESGNCRRICRSAYRATAGAPQASKTVKRRLNSSSGWSSGSGGTSAGSRETPSSRRYRGVLSALLAAGVTPPRRRWPHPTPRPPSGRLLWTAISDRPTWQPAGGRLCARGSGPARGRGGVAPRPTGNADRVGRLPRASRSRRLHNPNSRTAFSFRISGRTSSLMPIFSKSASQRSGVIHG